MMARAQDSGIEKAEAIAGAVKAEYLPNTVVLQLKPQHRYLIDAGTVRHTQLSSFLSGIGASTINKRFPNHFPPHPAVNERGEKLVDLSLIYSFTYTHNLPLEKVLNVLNRTGLFEYAEPWYIPQTCYTPNDPGLTFEYHLNKINAYQGWDISKGDTNIVIGITDTGTEFVHTDLTNIKYNFDDPVNGVDDDNDGYIDNYRGWDTGENDNNPVYTANAHGVHVSGLAAAATDNNIGMAGAGFKCKYLPVKIANTNGALTGAYEGIVYAADMGCQVINCSWGSNGGGQFGQTIVNYATFNKNSLVIGAAGNSGAQQDFFPASFQNVISVAATNNNDQRWAGSNFGYNVDVCAPGQDIYSTWPTDSYTVSSGTSMAAPIAAGVAAIIKSHFPSYTALQVGERMKVTCDNIYPLNSGLLADKLGKGRINLFKALTQGATPSVVNTSRAISDNNDNVFVAGDTLRIRGNFINYLDQTNNLNVTLSSTSAYVSIIDGSTSLGVIPTLGTTNNNPDPFVVKILPTAPFNSSILFKLTMTDGSYSAVQYFSVIVNVDYINIAINDIGTTITSKGLIGYNKDGQTEGLGFTYKGSASLLYDASLMISNSGTQVSDMARGSSSVPDNDFASVLNVAKSPHTVSEFDVMGAFNDNNNPSKMDLLVSHTAHAWSIPGHTKYVIVHYSIKNNGSSALTNLHAGIFADWDIMDYTRNKAAFDAATRMGYCWSTETAGLYAGIKLLSPDPVIHYALDNTSGGMGGINLGDGFDTGEKFLSLSTSRATAGGAGTGNDVLHTVSSGPFNLAPGDSVEVAFALIGGDSLTDILTSAQNAQQMFDSVPIGIEVPKQEKFSLLQNYPNPAYDLTTIEASFATPSQAHLEVFNAMGQRVAMIYSGQVSAGAHRFRVNISGWPAGMYYYRLSTPAGSVTRKMVISK